MTTNSNRTLLIDDVRTLKAHRIARTYDEGIKALTEESWDILLLDHDLGCFDENGREWTGYDILCFLEENPHYLPITDIRIVSANPAGRERMQKVIDVLYCKNED